MKYVYVRKMKIEDVQEMYVLICFDENIQNEYSTRTRGQKRNSEMCCVKLPIGIYSINNTQNVSTYDCK